MTTIKPRRRWPGILGMVSIPIVAVLVIGGVMFGHHLLPSRAAQATSARPAEREPTAVTVAPVTQRTIQRTVQIVGTFYGHDEMTLTPKVEGRVTKILHDIGDVVRPGDVLLEVEDTDYQLAVSEAERGLELELAKLGLKELAAKDFDVTKLPTVVRADFVQRNAQQKHDRLRASGRAATADDLEQAFTDFRVAQAAYQQTLLEAQTTVTTVRHRQAVLDTARQRLRDTRVLVPDPSAERLKERRGTQARTPMNAPPVEFVVAQRMASEGEMVRAFPSVPVFRLVMDRPLKLHATVPERYTGEVKVGQAVVIHVEAYPNETFQGTVSRVNPTVERSNRTFQIEVLVPNDDRRLKAGSFAKASILTRQDTQARTIPEEAVLTFAGVTKVFVVKDDQVRAVPIKPGFRMEITTGERKENWVEVLGELATGQQVVTTGHTQLVEGARIRIRNSEGQP